MSTTESEWWDSISVYVDNYEPGEYSPDASVRANHRLLDGLRNNDFDTESESYELGLLTLLLVFLVAGVLACIFVPLCYRVLNKSRKMRLADRLARNRGRTMPEADIMEREIRGGLLMLIVSAIAIASSVGAMYGLSRSGEGFSNIESNTQNVADDLRSVLDLPNRTSLVLDDVYTAYDDMIEASDSCTAVGFSEVLSLALDGFLEAVDGIDDELESVINDDIDELAEEVEDISDTAAQAEAVRRGVVWPLIALSVVAIICFILIGLTSYGVTIHGGNPCGKLTCIVLPGTVFLAAIIWILAAFAVSMSAMSGDFCIDAEANVQDLITSGVDGELAQELLVYYTTDCTSDNSVVSAIEDAQVGITTIVAYIDDFEMLVDLCDAMADPVDDMIESFREAWDILDESAEVTSCSNINGNYQQIVFDDFCQVLPGGLLAFWVSGVFLTVLLLVLVVQWARMLQRLITDEDFEDARRDARRSFWTSTRTLMRAASTYNAHSRSGRGRPEGRRQAEASLAPAFAEEPSSRKGPGGDQGSVQSGNGHVAVAGSVGSGRGQPPTVSSSRQGVSRHAGPA